METQWKFCGNSVKILLAACGGDFSNRCQVCVFFFRDCIGRSISILDITVSMTKQSMRHRYISTF